MYIIASTLVLGLIGLGFYFKKNTKLHALCMSLAFIMDVSLVLIIEINRSAINHVMSSNSIFVWFHVLISTCVILLYLLQIYIGINLAKQTANLELRKIHKIMASVFVVLRLINYLTSFSMPGML